MKGERIQSQICKGRGYRVRHARGEDTESDMKGEDTESDMQGERIQSDMKGERIQSQI